MAAATTRRKLTSPRIANAIDASYAYSETVDSIDAIHALTKTASSH